MTGVFAGLRLVRLEDLSWENVQPERWKDEYPVCGRSHQSPINIDFQTVTEDYTMRPIQFIDYDESPPGHLWRLENNGYTGKLCRSVDNSISSRQSVVFVRSFNSLTYTGGCSQ